MILNAPNPFRPGAGRVPPELTGRSNVLADYTAVLGSVASSGEGERPWIISGLRGVGKTVLLNQCGRDAIDAGWIVIKLEASSSQPLAVQLAKEIYVALRKAATASEKVRKAFKGTFAVFRSFQIKIDPNGAYGFGFDVQAAAGKADSGQLSTDLAEMLESLGLAARAAGTGVLLAIDELQEAPTADLEAMNVALHQLGQDLRPVPLMFLGTGLPSLPAVLAKASSYAERMYLYRTLDVLSPEDTKEALLAPSQRERVTWSAGALDMVLETSGGYPYFVQACGKHIWDVAASRTIDIDDARIGIGTGTRRSRRRPLQIPVGTSNQRPTGIHESHGPGQRHSLPGQRNRRPPRQGPNSDFRPETIPYPNRARVHAPPRIPGLHRPRHGRLHQQARTLEANHEKCPHQAPGP